ncbi:nitrilase, putative [Bisporella sp. PMI_857]|nr:nitrilase, putative [Bisporella sp. PMI_857]
MCSSSVMSENLAQVEILVEKAVAAGAKALFLPEASDYISHSRAETLTLVKSVEESEYVRGLQRLSKKHKIEINAGIHEPALGDSKKIRNTSIWISEGEVTQRYTKLHLFDMNIKGGPVSRESDVFEEGKEILTPFQTPIGKVGLMICFDLRYAEVPLSYKRQGAQIIAYPSAFTVPTGKVHWEILLRARAIETQAYCVAAAQAGIHNNGSRVTYGHSLIISPWGEILAELDGKEAPEIAIATVDLSFVERIRREVPLVRRTDVYPEL